LEADQDDNLHRWNLNERKAFGMFQMRGSNSRYGWSIVLCVPFLASCKLGSKTAAEVFTETNVLPEAKLHSQAHPPTRPEPLPGLHSFGPADESIAFIYLPTAHRNGEIVPLLLMLHGARGNPRRAIDMVTDAAEETGAAVIAPQSAGATWDVLVGNYGPDVLRLSRILDEAFSELWVDPKRLAIGGFSDGASYALSLGLSNGRLFSHVIAFSPGLCAPGGYDGSPRIFVSHGLNDSVLPIDKASRPIVARLRQSFYDVQYREFQGAHALSPGIAREALTWLVGDGKQGSSARSFSADSGQGRNDTASGRD
jgi:phospholipase/carboxylesterase